jgi:hypothetical protein
VKKYPKETLLFLSERVRERITMSRDALSQRYSVWAENEESFKAYIPTKDADALRKQQRKEGIPQYTTIEVPYSYSIAMTAHTYFTSVFMTRSPVLQLAGRHGESEMATQALESLMDYQLQIGGNIVPLFMWLFDPIKYSVGWIGHYWDKETIQCRKRVTQPKRFMGVVIPGTEETVDVVEEVIGYEGNRIYNIRPQDAFPDPRVSMWNFQKGEFFGRYFELSWSEIAAGARSGKYFNTAELRKSTQYGDNARDKGSSAITVLPDSDNEYLSVGEGENSVRPVVKAYELYVKVFPQEWKLADSDREEIWVLTCRADDYTVFGAQPLGLYHGKFPIDVLEQEPEAYDLFSRSMMEVMKPINDSITWLVNSHMYNVRAALNNQLVYDPSMVNSKDLESPTAGKRIRLKPAAYGRDVRTILAQLPVVDVTRGHINDMQIMADMLQRLTGVGDNVMGMLNSGGRKTATEVRQSASMGINRLKTVCEFFSAMGFAPMTQKLLQQTQQFYSREQQFRIVGDAANFAPGFANVTPETIAGFYDYIPVDGSIPIDRYAQANLWQQMLAQISKAPQIAGQYDLGRIFAWVASLAGLKNVQQFRIQGTNPQQLARQVQAGNAVPLEQSQRDLGLPPNQMQIPGMGQTA